MVVNVGLVATVYEQYELSFKVLICCTTVTIRLRGLRLEQICDSSFLPLFAVTDFLPLVLRVLAISVLISILVPVWPRKLFQRGFVRCIGDNCPSLLLNLNPFARSRSRSLRLELFSMFS